MAKKSRTGLERVMVSRRLEAGLWTRFQHFCEYRVPRASDTEMLEKAILEFLNRHEPKEKKGGANNG